MTEPLTLRLALTPGEPAGIGPDLCLRLASGPRDVQLVAIADPQLLAARARVLGHQIRLDIWQPGTDAATEAGRLSVWPVTGAARAKAGELDPGNAPYVLRTLEVAADACLAGELDAMVTAPVHKGNIMDAGIAFSGHTEFLQQRCGVARVVMMLATEGLRVALATTHLPLRDVADAITGERLTQVIRILDADLRQYFGLGRPRILVAGLNPHAGEGGHLGREEIEVIGPALERLRREGIDLTGPLPADTLFTPRWLDQTDAVLAMYHDQGLPVLKYKGFGDAVNITLGLPIIRTSVDHGTALDLAGSGRGDAGSLLAAIRTATTMARHRRKVAT